MVRKQVTIREDQEEFLQTLQGSDSANIQIALDLLKQKIDRERLSVSSSPSKKGGDE